MLEIVPVAVLRDNYVWLVHDPGRDWFDAKDDVLYVDRNGNGDLTEPGAKVAAGTRVVVRFGR